jgi:hypothetical protein
MKIASRLVFSTLAIASLLLVVPGLKADSVLNFVGLQNGEFVGNYYNGGVGSLGSGPGPNDGIVFSSNAATLISSLDGGTGNFINAPSDTIVVFLGSSMDIDLAGGFDNSLSFVYSAPEVGGSVGIWSGLDGTGTELASVVLPATGSGPDCPTFACLFVPVDLPFTGTAESVVFAGTSDGIGFDDIAFVPEPGLLLSLALGFVIVGGAAVGLRKRESSSLA